MLMYILLAAAFISLLGFMIVALRSSSSNAQGTSRSQIKGLVSAQRAATDPKNISKSDKKKISLSDSISDTKAKSTDSRLTLERKLYYAQWKISPYIFRVFQVVIGLCCFAFVQFYFNIAIQIVSLFVGWGVMNGLLDGAVRRRFKAFDRDYPQFLQSLVGLIKTGMNPMTAIGTAAQGLEDGCSVRNECELMLERLRYGVNENQSIGSFGEDVNHPEIELFVQALLLSRQVGGTLSDTLERLSRQVRKRQYFRAQAEAAVGMQRGSIWFILGVMLALEVYLYFIAPNIILDSLHDETGWMIWQVGFLVILIGNIWVKKVTKIKT
jgi:tight adherence protein B